MKARKRDSQAEFQAKNCLSVGRGKEKGRRREGEKERKRERGREGERKEGREKEREKERQSFEIGSFALIV